MAPIDQAVVKRPPARYRPRNAQGSPLYKLVQDHVEEFLRRLRDPHDRRPRPYKCVEDSFRAFLRCGVLRFGAVRWRCRDCGFDLFSAFSCKRRGVCPSCDAKRASVAVARATDRLLPAVRYRQWVLVVPKRIRYFLHHRPELVGEVCRLFAREIALNLKRKAGEGLPAQLHFVQRFGSSLNLHPHIHAVVSDGVFRQEKTLLGKPRLEFQPAAEPSPAEMNRLAESLRKKVLRRFLRRGALEEEGVRLMMEWEHSGFSIHAATVVPAGDDVALERLVYYCARPAVSVKRLTYRPEKNLAVYEGEKHAPNQPRILELEPPEFLRRLALLVPPPRRNQVRYYGALGPHAEIRPLLCEEVRRRAEASGRSCEPEPGLLKKAKEAVTDALRSWAALLSRVLEVDLACPACGGRLVAVDAIVNDPEILRLLEALNLPAAFPKTLPAHTPPFDPPADECQVDPESEKYLGMDPPSPDA